MSYRPPTLYKKTSTGALQEWTITVEGNVIVTRWGQTGGAIQTTTDVIKSGKNTGKKNATTPEQQAEAEALSLWEKKLKKGYVQTIDDAETGKVNDIIEGGISPMLAHRFDEQGHKIAYPAFAQPKFDGHRCIGVVKDGKASLWSRTRKPITGLPHIVKALEELSDNLCMKNLTLDGELYHHDYRAKFEELTSFIRNPEPKSGHEVVQYHIYDVVNSQTQSVRNEWLLQALFDEKHPLVLVETILVQNEDDLMEVFERFLAQGYEGLMVRNINGKYVNKRSYDLQKVKEFQDAEFTVVGVEEGRGKLAGHAIFVCAADFEGTVDEDAPRFRVKMKGETIELKKYFDNPKLVIGRQLTVKFQGYTKYGVPRFPVGERFLEDV